MEEPLFEDIVGYEWNHRKTLIGQITVPSLVSWNHIKVTVHPDADLPETSPHF